MHKHYKKYGANLHNDHKINYSNDLYLNEKSHHRSKHNKISTHAEKSIDYRPRRTQRTDSVTNRFYQQQTVDNFDKKNKDNLKLKLLKSDDEIIFISPEDIKKYRTKKHRRPENKYANKHYQRYGDDKIYTEYVDEELRSKAKSRQNSMKVLVKDLNGNQVLVKHPGANEKYLKEKSYAVYDNYKVEGDKKRRERIVAEKETPVVRRRKRRETVGKSPEQSKDVLGNTFGKYFVFDQPSFEQINLKNETKVCRSTEKISHRKYSAGNVTRRRRHHQIGDNLHEKVNEGYVKEKTNLGDIKSKRDLNLTNYVRGIPTIITKKIEDFLKIFGETDEKRNKEHHRGVYMRRSRNFPKEPNNKIPATTATAKRVPVVSAAQPIVTTAAPSHHQPRLEKVRRRHHHHHHHHTPPSPKRKNDFVINMIGAMPNIKKPQQNKGISTDSKLHCNFKTIDQINAELSRAEHNNNSNRKKMYVCENIPIIEIEPEILLDEKMILKGKPAHVQELNEQEDNIIELFRFNQYYKYLNYVEKNKDPRKCFSDSNRISQNFTDQSFTDHTNKTDTDVSQQDIHHPTTTTKSSISRRSQIPIYIANNNNIDSNNKNKSNDVNVCTTTQSNCDTTTTLRSNNIKSKSDISSISRKERKSMKNTLSDRPIINNKPSGPVIRKKSELQRLNTFIPTSNSNKSVTTTKNNSPSNSNNSSISSNKSNKNSGNNRNNNSKSNSKTINNNTKPKSKLPQFLRRKSVRLPLKNGQKKKSVSFSNCEPVIMNNSHEKIEATTGIKSKGSTPVSPRKPSMITPSSIRKTAFNKNRNYSNSSATTTRNNVQIEDDNSNDSSNDTQQQQQQQETETFSKPLRSFVPAEMDNSVSVFNIQRPSFVTPFSPRSFRRESFTDDRDSFSSPTSTSLFLTKDYKRPSQVSSFQKRKLYGETVRKNLRRRSLSPTKKNFEVPPQVFEVRYVTAVKVVSSENDKFSNQYIDNFDKNRSSKIGSFMRHIRSDLSADVVEAIDNKKLLRKDMRESSKFETFYPASNKEYILTSDKNEFPNYYNFYYNNAFADAVADYTTEDVKYYSPVFKRKAVQHHAIDLKKKSRRKVKVRKKEAEVPNFPCDDSLFNILNENCEFLSKHFSLDNLDVISPTVTTSPRHNNNHQHNSNRYDINYFQSQPTADSVDLIENVIIDDTNFIMENNSQIIYQNNKFIKTCQADGTVIIEQQENVDNNCCSSRESGYATVKLPETPSINSLHQISKQPPVNNNMLKSALDSTLIMNNLTNHHMVNKGLDTSSLVNNSLPNNNNLANNFAGDNLTDSKLGRNNFARNSFANKNFASNNNNLATSNYINNNLPHNNLTNNSFASNNLNSNNFANNNNNLASNNFTTNTLPHNGLNGNNVARNPNNNNNLASNNNNVSHNNLGNNNFTSSNSSPHSNLGNNNFTNNTFPHNKFASNTLPHNNMNSNTSPCDKLGNNNLAIRNNLGNNSNILPRKNSVNNTRTDNNLVKNSSVNNYLSSKSSLSYTTTCNTLPSCKASLNNTETDTTVIYHKLPSKTLMRSTVTDHALVTTVLPNSNTYMMSSNTAVTDNSLVNNTLPGKSSVINNTVVTDNCSVDNAFSRKASMKNNTPLTDHALATNILPSNTSTTNKTAVTDNSLVNNMQSSKPFINVASTGHRVANNTLPNRTSMITVMGGNNLPENSSINNKLPNKTAIDKAVGDNTLPMSRTVINITAAENSLANNNKILPTKISTSNIAALPHKSSMVNNTVTCNTLPNKTTVNKTVSENTLINSIVGISNALMNSTVADNTVAINSVANNTCADNIVANVNTSASKSLMQNAVVHSAVLEALKSEEAKEISSKTIQDISQSLIAEINFARNSAIVPIFNQVLSSRSNCTNSTNTVKSGRIVSEVEKLMENFTQCPVPSETFSKKKFWHMKHFFTKMFNKQGKKAIKSVDDY